MNEPVHRKPSVPTVVETTKPPVLQTEKKIGNIGNFKITFKDLAKITDHPILGKLNFCMLNNFFSFCWCLKINFIKHFQKHCQSVKMSVLIWAQNICKDYQQTTKSALTREELIMSLFLCRLLLLMFFVVVFFKINLSNNSFKTI